ncbi:C-X-C motif chemokine 11-1-like [Centroberyx affinis]|uniref:C-X-C motif chemokine 11-1-like n=1 Tax=Centroberyx affinis TaxID=166261 RepID=UPI003A5C54F2
MNSAVIASLACLLVLHVEGQQPLRSQCQCLKGVVKFIDRKLIKEYRPHYPSTFCPQTELIVTTVNGKKCLNPESKLGKILMQSWRNRFEKNEVSATTSGPMETVTSTTAHTSTQL